MDTRFDEYCDGALARSRDEDFDPDQTESWQMGWLDTGFQIEELMRTAELHGDCV